MSDLPLSQMYLNFVHTGAKNNIKNAQITIIARQDTVIHYGSH